MQFRFTHHIIDTDLPKGCYAQTALTDLDGDGRLEYILGRQFGEIYAYKYRAPDAWDRFLLGEDSPSDVGVCVTDVDGDGDFDLFACEMEAVPGDGAPRYFIWENVDGRGLQWREHVILDVNLGGHDSVLGDITGNGSLDIISKPWRPRRDNALGGKIFVVFLENVSVRA
ncbi:MAG: VCBS repeat-containing protein [Kiritimatiellae bacterium]|nr:VCBS repeat-containing protein [Kiritimatiellia bacterium]